MLFNNLKTNNYCFFFSSIIPISYYGGSSSSDESLSDDSVSQISKKDEKYTEKVRKKNEKSTGKKIKSSKLIDNSKETGFSGSIIGPQLPPDFHFPQDVPETVDDVENELMNKAKCLTESHPSSGSSLEECVSSKSCTDAPCSGSTSIKIPITYSESVFPQDTPESILSETQEKELKSYHDPASAVVKDESNESSNTTVVQENVETSQRYIFVSLDTFIRMSLSSYIFLF